MDDEAAKQMKDEDQGIETILFNQPNMVVEGHVLPNKAAKPASLPKAAPPAASAGRFFDGHAMDSSYSVLNLTVHRQQHRP